MMSIDTKSSSNLDVTAWSSKSRFLEASHSGGRSPSASDVAMKSSITQNPAAKTTSNRSSPGESSVMYTTSSPGPVKPAASLAFGKGGQSRGFVGGTANALQMKEDRSSSFNQSHNRGLSAKDDHKSPPSCSDVNKISSGSRTRKSSGVPGISSTGIQKGISSCRSPSTYKNSTVEKLSHSGLASERVVEEPIIEDSPAQGVARCSQEDATLVSSWISSPVLLNKHDYDHTPNYKSDSYRSSVATVMNPRLINVPKYMLTGSEGAGSPAVLRDEVLSMATDDSKRLVEGPPTNQSKSVKLDASSFSPMNALIEGYAKYSGSTSSLSLDDDVGMNLLASVAAGEFCRYEQVSTADEAKSRSSPEDCPREAHQVYNNGGCGGKKHAVLGRCYGDSKYAQSHFVEHIPDAESNKDFADSTEKLRDGESHGIHGEKATYSNVIVDSISKCANCGIDAVETEDDIINECKPTVKFVGAKPSDEGESNLLVNKGLNRITIAESEFAERANNVKLHLTECGEKSGSEPDHVVKVKEPNDGNANNYLIKSERLKFDEDVKRDVAAGEGHHASVSCFISHYLDIDANLEKQETVESRCPGSMNYENIEAELIGPKTASIQADETGKCAHTDPCAKVKFDLNDGFCGDAEKYGDTSTSTSSGSTTVSMINSLSFSVSSSPSGNPTSITVSSAAERQLVLPEDLVRSKVDLGWKGCAATSAFRPAEPRKVVEMVIGTSNSSCPIAPINKHGRILLDIDLNVSDGRVLEEMAPRGSIFDC